jgi:hypothetical protein
MPRIGRKDSCVPGCNCRDNRNDCRGAPFDLLRGERGDKTGSCSMPLGRYFVYTGGVLLALLLAISWYWQPQPTTQPARAEIERPPIRIETQHRWPRAVVFDTTQPTIVPPAPAPEVVAETPAATETPSAKSSRDAMAMVQEPEPMAQPAKPAAAPKRAVRRAKVARAPASRVASYDMFGFPGWGSSPSWRSSW